MNEFSATGLAVLLRTGLVLTISAIVVAVFLRVFKVASPSIRRVAYVAVMLQG